MLADLPKMCVDHNKMCLTILNRLYILPFLRLWNEFSGRLTFTVDSYPLIYYLRLLATYAQNLLNNNSLAMSSSWLYYVCAWPSTNPWDGHRKSAYHSM